MTPPNGTEHRAIVDTHRHPIGPKLVSSLARRPQEKRSTAARAQIALAPNERDRQKDEEKEQRGK